MKFASVLALAVAATVVSAETNAERLARGLPPLAPARRGTPVARAKRSWPSGTGQCSGGSIQCCDTVTTYGKGGDVDELVSFMGINIPGGTRCGTGCSPISIIGGGSGSSCKTQPVCCEDNSYNGIINVGCSPMNIW
ncbi:hydrophobin [Suillus spraguei]|nr:hydrophobin [Suillus spraguei]KAG2366481.1 hydrophobin [Suillus spraguei]